MSRCRYDDGEFMDLVWDGTPDAYYIKGHVSDKEGCETLGDWGKEGFNRQGQQKYGRWSMCGDYDGFFELQEYNNPGRGRFKITVFSARIFAKQPENKTVDLIIKPMKNQC